MSYDYSENILCQDSAVNLLQDDLGKLPLNTTCSRCERYLLP